MALVQDFIAGDLDDILRIREDLGAVLANAAFVTRTWTGGEVGEGTATEVRVVMDPQPGVVDLAHNAKVAAGGAIKQGDLFLTMISKNQYPLETDVNGYSSNPLVERFYEVNGTLYRVISVVEKHAYWNVQVRKLTDLRRF
jgi:hypothetical protein